MPKPNNQERFSGAVETLFKGLNERVLEASAKRVIDISERVELEVRSAYEAFFYEMQLLLSSLDAFGTKTPGKISKYTSWKPLSDDWAEYKFNRAGGNSRGFYHGVTDLGRAGRVNGLGRAAKTGDFPRRKDAAKRAQADKRPFQSFISSLADDTSNISEFFGPLSIEYEVKGTGVSTTVVSKNNLIQSVQAISTKGSNKGRIRSLPKNLSLIVTVRAFSELAGFSVGRQKGGEGDEFRLVDYFIKRLDPANEKQWVKINSRKGGQKDENGEGGTPRPIRPILAPLIAWYFDSEFPRAVREAFK